MKDFEKIVLNRFESRVFKLFTTQDRLNPYQIQGYFKFPHIGKIHKALDELTEYGLIDKKPFYPTNEFALSRHGQKYMLFARREHLKKLYQTIGVIASISAIAATLVTWLS